MPCAKRLDDLRHNLANYRVGGGEHKRGTRQGAERREAVLKFIAARFHVVDGNAAAGQLTVARLR